MPNAYESSSWSKSDWYNAAQSWQQMLSNTQMTPYGLQKALTEIGEDTSKAIDKNIPKKATKRATIKRLRTKQDPTEKKEGQVIT